MLISKQEWYIHFLLIFEHIIKFNTIKLTKNYVLYSLWTIPGEKARRHTEQYMTGVYYIADTSLTNKSAYTHHVIKMCDAFSQKKNRSVSSQVLEIVIVTGFHRFSEVTAVS